MAVGSKTDAEPPKIIFSFSLSSFSIILRQEITKFEEIKSMNSMSLLLTVIDVF